MALIKYKNTDTIEYGSRVVRGVNISAKRNGGDDRYQIHVLSDGTLFGFIADGSTGVGDGFKASELLQYICSNKVDSFDSDLASVFVDADGQIMSAPFDADTTGVVFLLRDNKLRWTAIGDTKLYVLNTEGVSDLSINQIMRPRIGGGINCPLICTHSLSPEDRLLVCTDGFIDVIPISKFLKTEFTMEGLVKQINADDFLDDDLSFIYVSEEQQWQ